MKVAVIGAGVCGLVAAYRIAAAGHAVDVYERWPGLGGQAATIDVGKLFRAVSNSRAASFVTHALDADSILGAFELCHQIANSLRYLVSRDARTSYHRITMRSVFVLIERRGEA